jgi:hypothetical protein
VYRVHIANEAGDPIEQVATITRFGGLAEQIADELVSSGAALVAQVYQDRHHLRPALTYEARRYPMPQPRVTLVIPS